MAPVYKIEVSPPPGASKNAKPFISNVSKMTYERLGFKATSGAGAKNSGGLGGDRMPLVDTNGNITLNQGAHQNKYKIMIGLPQSAQGKKQKGDRSVTLPVSRSWKVMDVLLWAENIKLGSSQTRVTAVVTPSGKRHSIGGTSKANKGTQN